MWSRSFSPHLVHVSHPLQASLWCPYFWHFKHFSNAGTYCSILSKQYLVFTSLGVWSWLNVKMPMCIWICFSPFLMVILQMLVIPFSQGCYHLLCCSQRQLLTTPLDVVSISWGEALNLVEWKFFLLRSPPWQASLHFMFSLCLGDSSHHNNLFY